ncbi:MAG: shikimate kinase [Chitinophagales bacterium]|nr:shikimate kinase [Chitinophagales bacterium]
MLIFLIGFMGCGKSYIGRNIAPILNYNNIDMDKAIEAEMQLSISEIFAQYGEQYFRTLEHKYIESLDINDNLIISTGGGAPCFNNNMELMNSKGITVYINRSKDRILEQLKKGMHKRPLLQGLTEAELSDFYDKKLAERIDFYNQAQIFTSDASVETIAEQLKSKIEEYFR